jgi:hypothetical protein
MVKKYSYLILFFLFFLFNVTLAAEVKEEESKALFRQRLGEFIAYEKPKEDFACELDTYLKYIPSRKDKTNSGSISIVQSAAEYSHDLKIKDTLPLQLGVETKYTGINNTTKLKLPSSLTFAAFGAEVTLPFFTLKDNYFRINIAPSLFGSRWNFRASSFRLLQQYFIISQPNEYLTLLLGVAVFPDFEDKVLPLFGFIWEPNDKISFNIIPKNPNITYSLNKRLEFFLEGDIDLGEYEVDRGEEKNLVLKYSQTIAGLGFRYNINKNTQFLFSTGGVFNRSLEYRDGSGKVSIKNGAYIHCQFQVRI